MHKWIRVMPEKHYCGPKWIKNVTYAAYAIFLLKIKDGQQGILCEGCKTCSTENVRK